VQNFNMAPGISVGEFCDEITFRTRRLKRGGVYAR
jgi:hypothetical protein